MSVTKRVRGLVLVCASCALLGGLALYPVPALARFTHVYSGMSFGPGGVGSGVFSIVGGIAVDQPSGDVYVYDMGAGEGTAQAGYIYKFNAAGEPANFEALGTNVITGVGRALNPSENEIAVDSSSAGSAKGDIYVTNTATGEVRIYSSKGEFLGSLSGGGQMCGVAVDPAGNVYVSIFPSLVKEYTPAGNPVTNANYTSSLWQVNEICSVAAGSTGAVYGKIGPSGSVTKYEASQFNINEEAAVGMRVAETGGGLAVDPIDNNVYISLRSSIARYDSTGTRLEAFGEAGPGMLSGSYDVAVNATVGSSASGDVYAFDAGGHRIKIYALGVPAGPPLVNIGEAQNATRISATFSGTVNPAGSPTSYNFVYIDDADYQDALAQGAANPYAEGRSTTSTDVGSGGEVKTATVVASELRPETTYHFALVATNALGSVISRDEVFTTAPRTPPVVGTGGASAVSQNGATISGMVDTQGLVTTYGFEIGTDTAYGPSTGLGSVGAGLSEATGSLALTGLQPGTVYHYRITATNVDGTVFGADETFTTSVYPNTFVEPPAPLPFVAVPAVVFPVETKVAPKALTRAQRLAGALKACRKKVRGRRGGCERQARRRYRR